MNNKPSANIICDSVAPNGVRLTTFVVTFHRYILAEVNTHRDLSRNSASSRAIPSSTMIDRVLSNPAYPISWGGNKPGMQAGEELTGIPLDDAHAVWQMALGCAVECVQELVQLGLHKQVANRLIEPFNWHTAIITTTKLDNLFWQRCHKDAQPEFKALADAMQYAYYMGEPKPLLPGQWHLPYADDKISCAEVIDFIEENKQQIDVEAAGGADKVAVNLLKQLSIARCARVSFLHHDGTRALDKDFDLYDKLVTGMHPSPMEHQGTPCEHIKDIKFYNNHLRSALNNDALQVSCKLQGNFSTGWHQLRKLLPNENRLHFIPNLPGLEKQADILKAGGKLW